MRMKKSVTIAIIVIVPLCLAVFTVIYKRPLKIEQRYPEINLSQCTQISGHYQIIGNSDEMIQYVFYPEDVQYNELVKIFQTTSFKTSFNNLLPQDTKVHRNHEGDFQWAVSFRFENVRLNEAVLSGELLSVEDFFGDLLLFFDGKQAKCSVNEKEQWLKSVLEVIMQ